MPSQNITNCRRVNDSPLFSSVDYLTVRRAMELLPLIEKLVIEMRFFHAFSIQEIARFLRIGWDEADALVDASVLLLKRHCYDISDLCENSPQFLEAA
jgi:DNA-directed RNA polymerase specialized sigma24 family protein